MKKHTKLLLILCMIISLLMPVSIAAAENESEPSKPEFEKLTDLKGKTFGLLTGAPFEELIKHVYALSGCREVHHTLAGCTVSTHCGPKTLGVLFIEK